MERILEVRRSYAKMGSIKTVVWLMEPHVGVVVYAGGIRRGRSDARVLRVSAGDSHGRTLVMIQGDCVRGDGRSVKKRRPGAFVLRWEIIGDDQEGLAVALPIRNPSLSDTPNIF